MRITAIRVLVFVASCLSIWFAVRKLRKDALGIRSTGIWIGLFSAIAIASVFPELFNYLEPLTGMKNRMFLVLLVGILILYAMLFNITSRIEKIERSIRKLVQERAIGRLGESASEDTTVRQSHANSEIPRDSGRDAH
jgi:hypothetical protein